MWENGSYKLMNSEVGMTGVKVKVIRQSCFSMEVRGSAKHFLGNEDCSQRIEARETQC